MSQPTKLNLPQDQAFEYAVKLHALDGVDYAGWKLRCDIKHGATIVHDFGELDIAPQEDGSGLAVLQADTVNWPTKSQLQSDLLIMDASGKVITRTSMFTIYIAVGVTNKVTDSNE